MVFIIFNSRLVFHRTFICSMKYCMYLRHFKEPYIGLVIQSINSSRTVHHASILNELYHSRFRNPLNIVFCEVCICCKDVNSLFPGNYLLQHQEFYCINCSFISIKHYLKQTPTSGLQIKVLSTGCT